MNIELALGTTLIIGLSTFSWWITTEVKMPPVLWWYFRTVSVLLGVMGADLLLFILGAYA